MKKLLKKLIVPKKKTEERLTVHYQGSMLSITLYLHGEVKVAGLQYL